MKRFYVPRDIPGMPTTMLQHPCSASWIPLRSSSAPASVFRRRMQRAQQVLWRICRAAPMGRPQFLPPTLRTPPLHGGPSLCPVVEMQLPPTRWPGKRGRRERPSFARHECTSHLDHPVVLRLLRRGASTLRAATNASAHVARSRVFLLVCGGATTGERSSSSSSA